MSKWALLLAVLFGCSVNAQQVDAQTGNIVYTTVNPAPQGTPVYWNGFVGTTSNGGGFSGGATPGYNPNTGTFMFGYMTRTVSYMTPINYALAAAGSDIRVNGFRYSWEYLNQGDYRGTLTGNINLTSNAGQIVQNYNYNMPQTTAGWTRMSGTETFNTQYAPSSLGNLNVSFTGKDDRFWAGYYGPQIRDIGVNLLYSIATPTIKTDFSYWTRLGGENDTFTLSKAGVVRYGANGVYDYKNLEPGTYSCSNGAWGKDPIGGVYKECSLGSNTTTTTPTVPKTPTTDVASVLLDPVTTTASTSTSPTTTTVLDPVVTTVSSPTATTNTTPSSQPNAVTAVVSAPAPSTTSSSSSSSSSASASSSSNSRENSGANTSQAMSIISRNQERDRETLSVAQSAVSAAASAAASAQQEAATVAATAVANSTNNNAAAVGGSGAGSTGFRSSSAASNTASQTSAAQLMPGASAVAVNAPQSQSMSTSALTSANTMNTAPVAQTQTVSTTGTGSNTVETNVTLGSNFLTDRANPINAVLEQRLPILSAPAAATTGPTVNTRVGDNEAAGGVSIAAMAVAPMGYGDYLNFTMRDAAFYAPREVYRNQRNVDNQRALRQLTNDGRHREMVEQQYRRAQ